LENCVKLVPEKESTRAAVRMTKQYRLHSGRGLAYEELDDEHLLDLMVQGDSIALETLYDRYASTVLGIAVRVIGDPAAAEDILQETFWRVWRQATTFQAQRGTFTGWLFKITRNLVIDRQRRRRARPQIVASAQEEFEIEQIPDPDADVSEQASISLKHQQMRRALAALPSAQRQVIELAYFYGMTRQEIAEATGAALGTIHTRARLGLKKLRQELQKLHFEA
jgi:RNA polymerase sigma-70 factor (ECF subfamily)